MLSFFDPNKLEDSATEGSCQDLGEQSEVAGRLEELTQEKAELPANATQIERASLDLEIADCLQFLDRGDEAWPLARSAFEVFLADSDYENGARACDILFQSNQPGSMAALGMGIWLGVTYPINPEISVMLLNRVVDDTPDDSDGAAVAAATAAFLVDLRMPEGRDKEQLAFFAQQLLGKIARRHSNVESEQQFKLWIERLELNAPDKFLVRLRNIVDVLVQDEWWFDRDALQAQLPE